MPFNDHGFAEPATCYLLPPGVDRLEPFLPVLEPLVRAGPSLFVTVVTLNLIEVSPRSAQLWFLVSAANTWLATYRDDRDFWVGHDVGRRVCVWIENVRLQEPAALKRDDPLRSDADRLLAALVNLGVADARRLEQALAREDGA